MTFAGLRSLCVIFDKFMRVSPIKIFLKSCNNRNKSQHSPFIIKSLSSNSPRCITIFILYGFSVSTILNIKRSRAFINGISPYSKSRSKLKEISKIAVDKSTRSSFLTFFKTKISELLSCFTLTVYTIPLAPLPISLRIW